MSIQYVNIGTNPNDGTGDDLRAAFLKVNDNFQLLATIGGETNYGVNLGGGSGLVYSGKTDEALNFRTLAAGTGISVVQDGNVIRITNSYTSPSSFTKVYDESGNYYEAQTPGSSFRILGGGTISTQLVGNELTISSSFSLLSDPVPKIGANLDLNNFNITGTGNISHVGNILTDGLTVGRSSGPGNYPSVTLLNGTLTVKSTSTLAAVTATTVNASTSITSPVINATGSGFIGTLTGNTNGTHYGNVTIKGVGVPDVVVVNTASNPATITGSHVGTFSGGLTGTVISGGLDLNGNDLFGNGTITITAPISSTKFPLVANGTYYPSPIDGVTPPAITNLGNSSVLSMSQQSTGMSSSLRLRSTSINSSQALPYGTSIVFEATNNINPLLSGYDGANPPSQPEYQLHGYLGILNYKEHEQFSSQFYTTPDDTEYSSFVARVRKFSFTGGAGPYLFDAIIARGNGRVTIGGGIDILDSTIRPYRVLNALGTTDEPSPNDLILTTDLSNTYINFYGDYAAGVGDGPAIGGYSFPKDIGSPGQVLAVRTPDGISPNNLLIWTTPSGGGGVGVTTFLNLTDTPNSYAAGDSGKILVVKSNLSGVEFSNSITASLIGNVTGNITGNASTATSLQNTRTINGKNFNGTQDVTLTTADVSEVTNLYHTDARARTSISVFVGTSLSYDSATGIINISESTSNTPSTLVKRDSSGDVTLGLVKVTTIQKNISVNAITIDSRVETASVIASTEDISTTKTISAGYISLTGIGDQTIASNGKLVLNPTTTIDVSGKKIINMPLTAPTADTDVPNKKYVDDQTLSVFNASLQNIPLTGDTGGSLSIIKNTTVTISGGTNINTSTTAGGVQVSLKSTISGVSISGNLPVSGTLTASTAVKAGNINITNNEIQQTVTGSNINLVPGSSGGSIVITGGDFKLTTNSRLFITGTNIVECAANSLEIEIPTTTPFTFVRTLNWVDDNAALAYAFMNDGTQGQNKTIIMLDRGNYGNALDTRPRYLILRGKFNGSSRTINIAASDPNGSSTFVFLDGFWWRTANVA
jgi:hypothetical protein